MDVFRLIHLIVSEVNLSSTPHPILFPGLSLNPIPPLLSPLSLPKAASSHLRPIRAKVAKKKIGTLI